MQKNFTYLLKNKIIIVADIAGLVTEYRPVYQKSIKVSKGIDNVLEFEVKNHDQKPISLLNYTPKFVAYDENKVMVLEKDGAVLDDVVEKSVSTTQSEAGTTLEFTSTTGIAVGQRVTGTYIKDKTLVSAISGNTVTLNKSTSSAVASGTDITFQTLIKKGAFTITITENDLLNIDSQYLSYAVYLADANNTKTLVYTNTDFTSNHNIYVDDNTFPGPADTYSVSAFTDQYTEAINAQPALNGNTALHTAAVYTDSYVGDVKVQATLDNQITSDSNWSDVATLSFNGTETEPKPVNFNGVFNYIRFYASADPTNLISKILIRN
jgi:hypothetical protein